MLRNTLYTKKCVREYIHSKRIDDNKINQIRKKVEKKMKKALIAVSGLIVVGGGLLTYVGGETIDRFNPLVKEKDVYVHTEGKGKPDPEHEGRRFYYVLNGVDESGNENTIKVGVNGKDEFPDNYLKVHVKGKYVYKYEEVQEEKVPEKAKEKLKQ